MSRALPEQLTHGLQLKLAGMPEPPGRTIDAAAIRQWITETLVQQMHVDPQQIDPEKRLTAYGLDSLQMISLVGQLEEWLGCRFTSNPLPLHPTIAALSHFIAARLAAGTTEIDPSQD